MAPRPDVSQQRKSEILDAAAVVFSRAGFHETRMDDVAEQAGVSKGTLYWYFESKEDLIFKLLDRMFEREFQKASELLQVEIPVREKLELILDSTTQEIAELEPLMPILFEFWGMVQRRDEVRRVMGRYYLDYLDVVVPLLQQGIEQGEFRQLDPRDVAVAMGAIIEGTIILWAAIPERIDLKEDIRKGASFILDVLIAD
ncbi:MAG: TetR family transcriptional regulator [Anaerolineales bacterium]|nr:TetR family transcriptional regulator [Anaerolineales bacterium]